MFLYEIRLIKREIKWVGALTWLIRYTNKVMGSVPKN
jgi:hypothetical protein